MRYDFNEIHEDGVTPKSIGFGFMPLPSTKELYFYITECGHYYCTGKYGTKRDYYAPILVLGVRNGTMTVDYRNHTYHLKKGDVILIDCQEAHYYRASSESLEFMFVHFDGSNSHEIVRRLIDNNGCLIRNSNVIAIWNMMDDILRFFEEGQVETDAETSLRVYRFLTYLQQDTIFTNRVLTPVEQAIEYVNRNMSRKITLHDLAEAANLSDYYFARYFKAQTGVSPIEYTVMRKLDYAQSLLRRTDDSTAEIAARIGYTERSFINLFSDHFDLPPQKFRRLLKTGR